MLINRSAFQAFVDDVFTTKLRMGDAIVIDNLGRNIGSTVRIIIEAAGTRLIFLPTYSPNPNSVIKVFAEIKARPL